MRRLLALLLVTTAWAGESTMPAERTIRRLWIPQCLSIGKPRCTGANSTMEAVSLDGVNDVSAFSAYGASASPIFELIRGRGTRSVPTAVQSGDVLGRYDGCG